MGPLPHQQSEAFSLTEVVLSLGVVAFCLMALLGLFAEGVNAGLDSTQTVRAGNLMTRLVTFRTAAPTSTDSEVAGPIPPLNVPADSIASAAALYLSSVGAIVPKEEAEFQLNYQVVPPPTTSPANPTILDTLVRVRVILSWPAAAPLNRTAGTFEMNFYRPKE